MLLVIVIKLFKVQMIQGKPHTKQINIEVSDYDNSEGKGLAEIATYIDGMNQNRNR